MDPETLQHIGYGIAGLLAVFGSAFSALKLQSTMKSSPVWDNGEKLGMRDAVAKLIIERNALTDRVYKLESQNERLNRIEVALEVQSDRIDSIERTLRVLRQP